jgi:hypothetical protein
MAIGLKIKHSTGEITTGTGNLTLNAAGNLVLDYATFPASDGSSGYVLSTDGAGNLSWIADDDTPAGYNNTNWDTAYGWGNHASGGYLTSIAANSINDTHIDWGTGSNQVSTADVPENTNLYYTDARADARVAAGSINNLVEDTTPQLGGTLDANSNTIDMGVNIITDAKVGNYDTAVATMPNWNLAYTHSQAAHAPSGAEVNQNAFTTVAVSGQSNVVADTTTDTLTLVAGSNVTLTTTPGTDSVTIAASGGGGSQNVFSTIAVSGQSNVVADATTDTLTLVAGSNVTLTTNAGADSVTIAASGGGGGGDTFKTIAVSGQTDVVADSSTDTLTLVAGSNMTLTTTAGTDTITFASSGGGGSSSFTFTVNYAAGGTSISTISNLPSGWSASINGANVTITHTAAGQPMGISFYGLDKSASPDIWKYQYPTSTYPVTFPDSSETISTTEFTLNIGTSATGANTGTPFATSLAHIKVVF